MDARSVYGCVAELLRGGGESMGESAGSAKPSRQVPREGNHAERAVRSRADDGRTAAVLTATLDL